MAIKFLNTVAVDTDVLYVDASSNNVGIGTTSPSTALDVYGTSDTYLTVRNSGGGYNAGIRMYGGGAGISHIWHDDTETNPPGIRFGTSANTATTPTTQMYIKGSDGNVGIGTTSPSAKFQISTPMSSTPTSNIFLDVDGTNTNGGGGSIIFGTSASAGTITNYNAKIQGVRSSLGDGSSDLRFYTTHVTNNGAASVQRMVIKDSGNVGIGTTSPGFKLDVSGNGIRNIRTTAGWAGWFENTGSSSGVIVTAGVDSGDAPLLIRKQDGTELFSIRGNGVSWFNVGNVGIGTTSPSEKLEVAGNARITGDVTLSNGNALRWTSDDVRIEGTTAGDNIKFYVANTEILQLAQSGTLATVTGNLRVTGAYYDSNNLPGTSGQVLVSTVTGTDWVSLSEISGVDGTGTANYLAKWSDSDTITDSVIYDNGTNVGIGTTSPGQNLEISTQGNAAIRLTSTNSTTSTLQFADSDDGNVGMIQYNHTDNYMLLRTNDGERMRITSSGNVGIGTTSPGVKLEVNSGGSDSVARFTSTDARARILISDNNDTSYFGTYNGTTFLGPDDTPSEDTINVLANGNVGIGTTSPNNKLTVSGASDGINILGGSSYIRWNSGDMMIRNEGSYAMGFHTYDGSASMVERMRINSSGKVGIGTTSPNAKLDVSGGISSRTGTNSAYSVGVLEISNGGSPSQIKITTAIPFGGTTNAHSVKISGFQYGSANTVDLQISWHVYNNSFYNRAITSSGGWAPTVTLAVESGYVVIHLSSPGYWPKMYVESLYNAFGGSAHAQGWSWTDAAISGDSGKPVQTVPYKANFGNDFLMTSGGNVGIGTTGPSTTLQVYNSTEGQYMEIGAGDGGGRSLVFTSSNNNGSAGALHTINAKSISGAIALATAGSERMRITNTGNVGIGTTSPQSKLHLATTGGSTLTIQNTTNSGNAALNFRDEGGNDQFQVYYALGANRSYNLVNGNGLTIYSSQSSSEIARFGNASNGYTNSYFTGNVGIGTTSPSQKLEVIGGDVSGPSITWKQTNRRSGYLYSDSAGVGIYDTTLNNAGIYLANNSRMDFRVNGSERMRITSSGNVGIGTTSPSQKLHVAGNARVTGAYYDSTNSPGTSGQVLSSTATGTDWVSLSEISGVDGTGTTNYVAKWSDTDTITDSVIYDNGTNVGINDIITGKKLSVKVGSSNDDGIVIKDENGNIRTDLTLAGSAGVREGRIKLIDNSGNTNVQIHSDTVSYFNGGNVGIGTTSPSAKLEVNGAGNFSGGTVVSGIDTNTNVGVAIAKGDYLYSNDGNYLRRLIGQQSGGSIDIGQQGTGLISNINFFPGTSGNIDFFSSGSIDMRVASSGNIGIGTTSPSYKLDVSGGAKAGGVITYSKSAGSLDTTGYAVAGLTTGYNGNSAGFTFTCFGHGGYQKVVYSCYNVSGTWNTIKVIDEGTNAFDVEASANASTITFTFKTVTGTKNYTPRVTVEATGSAINSTYA